MILKMVQVILIRSLVAIVNCEKRPLTSSPTTPSISPLPSSIPSSTSVITLSPSTLMPSSRHDDNKSIVIPVRLKLSKEYKNSTSSSVIPVSASQSYKLLHRWFPFNRLFGRKGRQNTVQLTATIALAVLAALSAIILALLIALLISIGSLGYAIKKCSFGFGKYLYKLFGSIDHHTHKYISIIHLITRILNEVLGRTNQQTDFLFHLIHFIRELGLQRQHHSIGPHHDIGEPHHELHDRIKGFEHQKGLDNGFEGLRGFDGLRGLEGPPRDFEGPPRGFEGPPRGFEGAPRGFDFSQGFAGPSRGFDGPRGSSDNSRNFDYPQSFDENRDYSMGSRGFDHPFNFINKTTEYGLKNRHHPDSYPNLQYQYLGSSSRQQSDSSMYDPNRHPNHNYDTF